MTISSGVYTVGPNRDYADWKAAADDLSTGLTDDLYFIQLGEISMSAEAEFNLNLNGHNLVLSCPFPHKGHPRSGLKTNFSGSGDALSFLPDQGQDEGSVVINNLYIERDAGASPIGSDALIRVVPSPLARDLKVFIHDLILDGNNKDNVGIRISTKYKVKIWNIKGKGFLGNPAGALIAVEDIEGYADDLRIENCTAHDCFSGFRIEGIGASVGKFLNCIGFECNDDFKFNAGQLGSGNISQDATAEDFVGESNLHTYNGVTNSPNINTEFRSLSLLSYYLRIKEGAVLLPSGGVASEIDFGTEALRLCPKANGTGAEGNGRPGSDKLYSRGADEYREEFPGAWSRRVRLLADGSKLEYSWDLPILIRRDAPGMPDDFAETAKAYGEDVRVTTDPEGQHPVPVEAFRFGPDGEDFTIWAAPEIFPEPTPLYVWWGNPNASQVPHRGSGPTDSGLNGGADIWSGAALVLHMGNEFDDPRWCFDSTSGQRHPWIEGMSSWGLSGYFLPEGVAAGLNGSVRFNAQSVENVLKGTSGVTVTAALNSSITPHVDSVIEAVRSGIQRLSMKLNQRLVELAARAPDSQPAQSLTGDTNLGTVRHLVSAMADIYNDHMKILLDGVVDDDESRSFVSSSFDSTDLDTLTVGREISGANGYAGGLAEVRLWNWAVYGGWPEAMHQNLDPYPSASQAEPFFLPAYAGGDCMPGTRNFKFDVAGSGPFKLENTDFWLSYENDGTGGLKLRLNGIWDKICPATAKGLLRRQELEAVVRELSEWYTGFRGTLTIDADHANEVVLSNVSLLSVSWDEISTNAGLIYTLEFGVNIGIEGAQFARLLVFGSKALAADNLVVEYGGRDQTQFKEIFRAAPVRIPGGPPIKLVRISAIVEPLGPGGLPERRRQAEAIIRDWVDNHLGQEANLTIDGIGFGKAHLADVRAESLNAPEAAGYSLDFVVAYGS